MKTNKEIRLEELEAILKEGEKLGLNLKEVYQKINGIKNSIDDEKIKIALLSSFSDGKTSIIAGLNEKIEANMKIDSDESSDEIIVYHPEGLAKDFEIMDTPGLFGSKEKEVDGEKIRFSEITERFISEAHIILYVCDAVTPLKESHAFFIEKIMRKFNKLNSTIFVINKMDEAGYDLLDEEDFQRGVEIKKQNLITRLQDTIGLTQEEKENLNIVCISADPKGKGLDKWFEKIEDYKKRSRIEDLRSCINEVVSSSNKEHLLNSVEFATTIDIIDMLSKNIQTVSQTIGSALDVTKEAITNSRTELMLLKKELSNAQKTMTERLNELKNRVLSDLNACSMDGLVEFLEQNIGVQGDELSFYVFDNELNQIVRECSEGNNAALETHVNVINTNFANADSLISNGLKKGTELLKHTRLTGETVKTIRNYVAQSYKFKPWGAIKLASKINKAIPFITVGIEALFAWRERKKQEKQMQEFESFRGEIKDAINKKIATIFDTFKSDEEYLKNYVPSYGLMQKEIEQKETESYQIAKTKENLDLYNKRISDWLKENAKDAEYEEIK